MSLLLWPVTILMVISGTLAQPDIPEEVMKEEKLAFQVCNTDGKEGLTWPEVEACEEKYSDLLESAGQTIPSQEDFESSDLNGDGTLLLSEWVEWVTGQLEEMEAELQG